jgi:glutathione S-transferase
MKLFYSPNSPYARKCRVVILEKGLQDLVEMISVLPAENPAELLASNPLGTVPTLVLDNGNALCESPVICEYLDSLSGKNPLFPTSSTEKFAALGLSALADGIMDAAVSIVMEGRRPEEKQYAPWVERKEKAILRTISAIANLNTSAEILNIGTINMAIALEYVSFRLSHLKWREENAKLANWLDLIGKNQSLTSTRPIYS